MKKLIMMTAVGALLLSCGGQTEKEKAIRIDGSSTVFPITEAMAEEFRSVKPRVDITIGVSGTGGGFQKFTRGEIDIANASRSIKEEEAKIAADNNIDFIELKVAFDGMAIIAHPENDWLECITTDELKLIWEPAAQGVIKKWNQIRPEWPDEEIRLYGAGVASGTFDYFTEVIMGKSGSSRGDYTASEDDNVLVQGVSGDKYSLGYFGLAYYEENKENLKLIGVNSGDGCVYPSLETVSNGTYTPLSRPMFIYVNSTSLENPAVVEFVRFYITQAPNILEDVGYVPMTTAEYEAEMAKFNEFMEKNVGETATE